MKILGIIPARHGSKRVPHKNFRPFAGTSLIDLAIKQALEAKKLDRIVVNSDSPEVLKAAKAYMKQGVEVLERPEALATDTAPAIDYMLQTISYYEDRGERYDLIVIIQPSSPLRTGADIDATITLLETNPTADSAVSVVSVGHMVHPHKLKRMEGNALIPWLVDEGQKTAAHEIPNLYVRNCAVYVFKTQYLLKGVTYGNKSLGYLMPPETSVDINDMLDFEFAEYLFEKAFNI